MDKVTISSAIGGVYTVTLEPPVPGMLVSQTFALFDEAAGYAAGWASEFCRQMVDETGRLSPLDCATLVMGSLADEMARAGDLGPQRLMHAFLDLGLSGRAARTVN